MLNTIIKKENNRIKNSLTQTKESNASFIPVTCHYDDYTVLDKNSNLIQVIEVSGFEPNDDEFQVHNLKTLLQDAIQKYIPDSSYVVYIHVIRDRTNIVPNQKEPFGFPHTLGHFWCTKNNWDKQLSNKMYISVLKKYTQHSIFNTAYLIPFIMEKKVKKTLREMSLELNAIVSQIEAHIIRFGSKKLTIKFEGYKCISEIMTFYHKLIYLSNKEVEISIRDYSGQLSDFIIQYHFNHSEITFMDQKRYAAIYSLKESPKISSNALDLLLQIGSQMIISECIQKVNSNSVKKQFINQEKILKASKSTHLFNDSNMANIIHHDDVSNKYCLYQSNIIVYSDDKEFFQKKVLNLCHVLGELGINAIREDFNMARMFWSILPGNMFFLNRSRFGTIYDVCAFSDIQHLRFGFYNGSKWGVPITLFRNIDGSPFYFNFHGGENGHTILVGPKNTGKTTLVRFLITQSFKLNPRIIYIDVEGHANKFLTELGGIHIDLDDESIPTIQTPPFCLRSIQNQSDFIKTWFKSAINAFDSSYDKEIDIFIQNITEKNKEKGDEYNYDDFLSVIESIDNPDLKELVLSTFEAESMQNFFGENIFDVLNLEKVINIDVSKINNNKLKNLYVNLLLAKIPDALDGNPTIIALSNASFIFEDDMFSLIVNEWLKKLIQQNCIVVMPITNSYTIQNSKILNENLDLFNTQIFLSDRSVDKYFKKAYKLDEWELYKIKSYDANRRMFLLKQRGLRIISNFNLDSATEITEVMCSQG